MFSVVLIPINDKRRSNIKYFRTKNLVNLYDFNLVKWHMFDSVLLFGYLVIIKYTIDNLTIFESYFFRVGGLSFYLQPAI